MTADRWSSRAGGAHQYLRVGVAVADRPLDRKHEEGAPDRKGKAELRRLDEREHAVPVRIGGHRPAVVPKRTLSTGVGAVSVGPLGQDVVARREQRSQSAGVYPTGSYHLLHVVSCWRQSECYGELSRSGSTVAASRSRTFCSARLLAARSRSTNTRIGPATSRISSHPPWCARMRSEPATAQPSHAMRPLAQRARSRGGLPAETSGTSGRHGNICARSGRLTLLRAFARFRGPVREWVFAL